MIIGLVEDDTLYLKVDDVNRGRFEDAGGRPFTYDDKAGQTRSMSYWTVPDHLLDDSSAMVEWARTSLDAAKRAKAPARKAAGKGRATGKVPKAQAGRTTSVKRKVIASSKAKNAATAPARTKKVAAAAAAKTARSSKSKRST